MFRVDQALRLPMPPKAFGEDESVAYYDFAEIVGGNPIWLIQGLTRRRKGVPSQWKRVLAGSVVDALQILSLNLWSERRLYVLLPDHMTGSNLAALCLCTALHQCKESGSDQICWRISTHEQSILVSALGSKLGTEREPQCMWCSENQGSEVKSHRTQNFDQASGNNLRVPDAEHGKK